MKKARTCLYVDRQDDFTRVSPLLELPGDLRLAISGWRSQVGDLGGVGIPAFAGMASVRATSDQNMKDQFESGIIDFCFACRTQVRGVLCLQDAGKGREQERQLCLQDAGKGREQERQLSGQGYVVLLPPGNFKPEKVC